MQSTNMAHPRSFKCNPSNNTTCPHMMFDICHQHCRRVTVRIETIIMYKGNVVLLGNHQHQSLRLVRATIRSYVCVHDVAAVLGYEEVVVVVFISSIPAQKIRVTTNASKKRPSATFDDPNIDWLSVQKDIVILWNTDLDLRASQLICATGDMN
jgi:hypothetical protein